MEMNEGAAKHGKYLVKKAGEAFRRSGRTSLQSEKSDKEPEKSDKERSGLWQKARDFVRKGGDVARYGRGKVIETSQNVFPSGNKTDEVANTNSEQKIITRESSDIDNLPAREDYTPSPQQNKEPEYNDEEITDVDDYPKREDGRRSTEINKPNSIMSREPSKPAMIPSKKNLQSLRKPESLPKTVTRSESSDTYSIDKAPIPIPRSRPISATKTENQPVQRHTHEQTKPRSPEHQPQSYQTPNNPETIQNLPGQPIPQGTPNIPYAIPAYLPPTYQYIPVPQATYPMPQNYPCNTNVTAPPYHYPPQQPPTCVGNEPSHGCKRGWVSPEDDPQKYCLEKKFCRWLIRLMLERNVGGTGAANPCRCTTDNTVCGRCGNITDTNPVNSNTILKELLRRQGSVTKYGHSQNVSKENVSMRCRLNNQITPSVSKTVLVRPKHSQSNCATNDRSKHTAKNEKEFFVDVNEVTINEQEFKTLQISIARDNNKPINRPIRVNLDVKQLCDAIREHKNDEHSRKEKVTEPTVKRIEAQDRQCQTIDHNSTQTEPSGLTSQIYERKHSSTHKPKNGWIDNEESRVKDCNTAGCNVCACKMDEDQIKHITDTLYTLKDINVCVNSIKDTMIEEIKKAKENVVCCCHQKQNGLSKQVSFIGKITDSKHSSETIEVLGEIYEGHAVPLRKSQVSLDFVSGPVSKQSSYSDHSRASASSKCTSNHSRDNCEMVCLPRCCKGCHENEYILMKYCMCDEPCHKAKTKSRHKQDTPDLASVSQIGLNEHHEDNGFEERQKSGKNKLNTGIASEEEKVHKPMCCNTLHDGASSGFICEEEIITTCICTCNTHKKNIKDDSEQRTKVQPKPKIQRRNSKPMDENESKHMSFDSDKQETEGKSNGSCGENTTTFDSMRDLYSSESATANATTLADSEEKTSSNSSQSTTSKVCNLIDCVNNLKYDQQTKRKMELNASKKSYNEKSTHKQKVKLLPHDFYKDLGENSSLKTSDTTLTFSKDNSSSKHEVAWDQAVLKRLLSVQKFIARAKRLDGFDLQLLKQKFESNIRQRYESTREVKVLDEKTAQEKDKRRKGKERERKQNKETYRIEKERIRAKDHGRRDDDYGRLNVINFLSSYLPSWSKVDTDRVTVTLYPEDGKQQPRKENVEIDSPSQTEDSSKENTPINKPVLEKKSKEPPRKENVEIDSPSQSEDSSKENTPINKPVLEKKSKELSKSSGKQKETDRKESVDSEKQVTRCLDDGAPCIDQTPETNSRKQKKHITEKEVKMEAGLVDSVETDMSKSDDKTSTGELISTKQIDGIEFSSSGPSLGSDTDPCTKKPVTPPCVENNQCCKTIECCICPSESSLDIYCPELYYDACCTPCKNTEVDNQNRKTKRGVRMYYNIKDINKDFKLKHKSNDNYTDAKKTPTNKCDQMVKPNPCNPRVICMYCNKRKTDRDYNTKKYDWPDNTPHDKKTSDRYEEKTITTPCVEDNFCFQKKDCCICQGADESLDIYCPEVYYDACRYQDNPSTTPGEIPRDNKKTDQQNPKERPCRGIRIYSNKKGTNKPQDKDIEEKQKPNDELGTPDPKVKSEKETTDQQNTKYPPCRGIRMYSNKKETNADARSKHESQDKAIDEKRTPNEELEIQDPQTRKLKENTDQQNIKDKPCRGIRMYCNKKETNKDFEEEHESKDVDKDAKETPGYKSDQLEKQNPCDEDIGTRKQNKKLESTKEDCQKQRNGNECCHLKAPRCVCPKGQSPSKNKQITCDTVNTSTAELYSLSWTPSFSSISSIEAHSKGGDTHQVDKDVAKKQETKRVKEKEKVKDNSVKLKEKPEPGCNKVKEKVKRRDRKRTKPEDKILPPCEPKISSSDTSSEDHFAQVGHNPPHIKRNLFSPNTGEEDVESKKRLPLPTPNLKLGMGILPSYNSKLGSSVDPKPIVETQRSSKKDNSGDANLTRVTKSSKKQHSKSKHKSKAADSVEQTPPVDVKRTYLVKDNCKSLCECCTSQKLVCKCKPVRVHLFACKPIAREDKPNTENKQSGQKSARQEKLNPNLDTEDKDKCIEYESPNVSKPISPIKLPRKIRITFRQTKEQSIEERPAVNENTTVEIPDIKKYSLENRASRERKDHEQIVGGMGHENTVQDPRKEFPDNSNDARTSFRKSSMEGWIANSNQLDVEQSGSKKESKENLSVKRTSSSLSLLHESLIEKNYPKRRLTRDQISSTILPVIPNVANIGSRRESKENFGSRRQSRESLDIKRHSSSLLNQPIEERSELQPILDEIEDETPARSSGKSPKSQSRNIYSRKRTTMEKLSDNNLPVLLGSRRKSNSPLMSKGNLQRKVTKISTKPMRKIITKPQISHQQLFLQNGNVFNELYLENQGSHRSNISQIVETYYPKPCITANASELLKSFQNKCSSLLPKRTKINMGRGIPIEQNHLSVHERLYQQRTAASKRLISIN